MVQDGSRSDHHFQPVTSRGLFEGLAQSKVQVWKSSTEVRWEVLQRLQPGEGRQWPGHSLSWPDLRPLPLQVLPGLGLSAPVLLLQFLCQPGLPPQLLSHQAHHQAGQGVSGAVVRQPEPALQTVSPPLLLSTDGGLPLPLSPQ